MNYSPEPAVFSACHTTIQGMETVGFRPETSPHRLTVVDQVESRQYSLYLSEAPDTAPVDPDIRRRIADENMQLAQVEQALFTRLVRWRQPQGLGTVVDPVAETKRLRANQAEGKPVTEGESPVITQRRQSVLQGFLSEVF
jgi:hypothetical protein